jgi:ribosomal protein S8
MLYIKNEDYPEYVSENKFDLISYTVYENNRMNEINMISVINSNIKNNHTTFFITIKKKYIDVLDKLNIFGYLSYIVIQQTPNSISCKVTFTKNNKHELILKQLKIISKSSKKLYTKKHKYTKTKRTNTIQYLIRTTKGIFFDTNSAYGEFLIKISA